VPTAAAALSPSLLLDAKAVSAQGEVVRQRPGSRRFHAAATGVMMGDGEPCRLLMKVLGGGRERPLTGCWGRDSKDGGGRCPCCC